MAWLTKSRFTAGLQCAKRLWNEVHDPLAGGIPDNTAFMNGRAVDQLVQKLRPGTVISREAGMPAAIAETSRLLRNGAPPLIYQPAFRAGELAVIADVLRMSGAHATLVEVKSSTGVKSEHLPDVGFQTLVLRQCKVPVDRVLVAHVDASFVLRREGDYEGLIAEQDVTSEVEEALPQLAESAAALQAVMASERKPTVPMGEQCTNPYDCPFIERCTRERGGLVEFPVELLPRGGKVVNMLLAAGYADLAQVPDDLLEGELHRRVQQSTVTGEPYFDAAATASLRTLGYPRAHLDFETIGLAVPAIIGTRPYEQVPFQWSVHVEESATQLRHAECLALANFGDFAAMAQALLAALPESGPVFAYNAPFERGVLNWLAARLPLLANALRAVAARLVDLLPVTRAAYYHRDMKGSWSIKSVLPTIDPALDYAGLGEVQEGGSAQLAFLQLRSGAVSSARRAALTRALLKYCERDTWGLVVLRRFLCEEMQP